MHERILIVEDQEDINALIALNLEVLNYQVSCALNGTDGLQQAQDGEFDLIILDVMLPGIDGLQICKILRANNIFTPILMLTARKSEADRVVGLEVGADDYLTKPFDKRELIARIQAIVRRSQGHAQSIIETGDIKVNLDTRTIEAAGKPLHLTGKEYGILELLSLRKGSTLTKEMFLNHLYGGMDEPEAKIIDVFICKLRKKLADATDGSNYIETVWGRGYVLRDPNEGSGKKAVNG